MVPASPAFRWVLYIIAPLPPEVKGYFLLMMMVPYPSSDITSSFSKRAPSRKYASSASFACPS